MTEASKYTYYFKTFFVNNAFIFICFRSLEIILDKLFTYPFLTSINGRGNNYFRLYFKNSNIATDF